MRTILALLALSVLAPALAAQGWIEPELSVRDFGVVRTRTAVSVHVRGRVARLIVGLVERTREPAAHPGLNGPCEVALPMTRRDMAELLCTRPETLTRALQALEDDGLLRNAGHRLAIPSLSRLRAETVPHVE